MDMIVIDGTFFPSVTARCPLRRGGISMEIFGILTNLTWSGEVCILMSTYSDLEEVKCNTHHRRTLNPKDIKYNTHTHIIKPYNN